MEVSHHCSALSESNENIDPEICLESKRNIESQIHQNITLKMKTNLIILQARNPAILT